MLPTVFNPKEYYTSEMFAEFIKSLGPLTGKYVLDMGCGSGVVSVFAAAAGAEVYAVDINPMAVKSAMLNARQNGLAEKVNAIESDLFLKLPADMRKFDIIFFNPPYFKGIAASNFELAFKGGEDYEVIRKFIAESGKYLLPKGEIYFIISSDMKLDLLEKMFTESRFDFRVERKIEKLLETFYITKSLLIKS